MQKQSISEEELWSVLKEARKTNPEVKKNYKNICQRGFNAKEQSHSKYSLSSSLELYKLVNFSLYTVFSLVFKHVPITFSNYFLLSLQKIKK